MSEISYWWVLLAAALAMGGAGAGILVSSGRRARVLVPVSGGLLTLVALFALIPETAEDIGWMTALTAAGGGYVLLEVFDRMGLPVCPSCSHSHGFSVPLVAATAIHALVDGWGMTASHSAGKAFLAVLLLHKIPEGLALGTILRMSSGNVARALGLAVLAEAPTLIGGVAGLWSAEARWISYPLALAGGAYLFLGLHAVKAWVRPTHIHDHGQS